MENREGIISGTKWTTISTLSVSVVQVLRLSILARFLTKTDFGLVAIVTFVLGLTQTFCDLGFSSAIMSKKDLDDEEFSALYWIQFLLFVIVFALLFVFAPFIASIYQEPNLKPLLYIALVDILFWGVGKLYDSLFLKYFQFKVIAIRNIVAVLVSLIVAFVLAFLGFGAFSLVISTLVQTLVLNVWNLIKGQSLLRLRLSCNFSKAFPLIKVGAYQMGTQILDYVSSRLDILIIGKFLGTELLGVYNLAKELALKVIMIINSIANKVSLPFFSFNQSELSYLRNGYYKVIRLLSAIDFPICYLVGVFSFCIVPILYGDSYVEVIPLLAILSIWSSLVSVISPVGNIVIATGKTKLSFYYTGIRLFYAVPIVFVSCHLNVYYVAIAQVFIALIDSFAVWYIQIKNVIEISFKDYYLKFMPHFVLLTIVGTILYLCAFNYSLFSRSLFDILLFTLITFIIGGVITFLLWREEYYSIICIINRRNK